MIDTELLKQFEFFSNIDQDELEKISQLCVTQEFNSGDIIFNQNEKAEKLYGVLEGEVELRAVFKEKTITKEIQYEESVHTKEETVEKPIKVSTIGPNKVFSWSAFVKPKKSTATAVCLKDTRVFFLPATEIYTIFEKDPAFGYIFMTRLSEIICRRLRERTEKLVEIWSDTFGTGEID